MTKQILPKSARIHIRRAKASLRRSGVKGEALNNEEQKIYSRFIKKSKNK